MKLLLKVSQKLIRASAITVELEDTGDTAASFTLTFRNRKGETEAFAWAKALDIGAAFTLTDGA